MSSPFDLRIRNTLDTLQQRGLRRQLQVSRAGDGPRLQQDGKALLSFASNDYLGLKQDPRLLTAFKRAADRYGVGAGAAHLLGGHSAEHAELERELADWLGRPGIVLFASGYQAALGTMAAVLGRHDRVLQDRLNHACLLDGGVLSRARLQRYPHQDLDALAALLAADPERASLIVSDSVFSMDGDCAQVPELAALARDSQSWLMLDEAHALGVLGPDGAGLAASAQLDCVAVPIVLGTLGKAFGTAGAFIAGSCELREFLINRARSFVYSTALPAAIAAATREALRIVRGEQWRRDHLVDLIVQLRSGLADLGYPLADSITPIQPVLLGTVSAAVAASAALREAGFVVPAIRPPTVPEGSARLRISLSAAHSARDVEALLAAFEQLRPRIQSAAARAPLHLEKHGETGPSIILLHGWGLHGGIFQTLVEQLKAQAQVWVVDLPGHGHSRNSSLPLDLNAVIAAIIAVVPQAHWFGWSLGGLFALHAALAAPEAVQSLTMCAATPCFVANEHWSHGMPLQVFESFAGDLEDDWQGTLERFLALETLGSEQPITELHELKQIAATRSAPHPQALKTGLRLLAERDLSTRLGELRMPCLWLGGRRDRVVSAAALTAAASASRGQLSLLDKSGHAPFLTRSAEVAALLLDHTSRL
jgi:8-amino-7-oxononanoate synthase